MTLQEFIQEQGITVTVTQTDDNPGMTDMPEGSRHWKVVFAGYSRPKFLQGQHMTVFFSQGPAHTDPPTGEDVLDCLASDASTYDNAQGFEDWANEYGYDTDSRKAEKIFKAVEKQSIKLAQFLPTDAYQNLLWDIERL